LLSYSLLRCTFRERSNRAERLPRPETPQFVPTERVPSTLRSLVRSSVMLLLKALDPQMLTPPSVIQISLAIRFGRGVSCRSVLFRKHPFEPMCLSVSEPLIHERGIMTYEELLAATITPERSHFLETRRFLLPLSLLYCDGFHLLNFLRIR